MTDPDDLRQMLIELLEPMANRIRVLESVVQQLRESNNRIVDAQGIEIEFILARMARMEARTPEAIQAAQERLFALEERKKVFRLRHDLRGGNESKNDSTSG